MLQAAANHDPARQQLEEVIFFSFGCFFLLFFCSQRRMLLLCECWCHLQCSKLQFWFVVCCKKTVRTRRQKVTHNMPDFAVLQVKTRSPRVDRNFHFIRHSLCISYPRCDQCMPALTHPLTSICATQQWLKWAWLVSAESPWQGYKYGLIRPTDGHPASHWVIRLYLTTRSELGC